MKKRLYRDGQDVYVKNLGVMGVVTNYRHGHNFPYVVKTTKGLVYRSYKGLALAEVTKSSDVEIAEEKTPMANIRQAIKALTKSKEERLFEKYEITDDKGNLTDLGRRVVMDKLFGEDKELRAAVLADVEAVDKEANKKSK